MKHVSFIIPLVAVMLVCDGGRTNGSASTAVPAPVPGKEVLQTGDLSPIHAAYEKGDLGALWQYYLHAHLGRYAELTYVPDPGPWLTGHYTPDRTCELNWRIEEYAARLLAQSPGHAKHLGDQIDKLVAASDGAHDARAWHEMGQLLKALKDLATPECVQQLGRFLWDERGVLTDEEARREFDAEPGHATLDEGRYLPPAQSGAGEAPLSAVSMRAALPLAQLFDEPFFSLLPYPESIHKNESRLDLARNIRRWWRSAAAARFRQVSHEGPRPAEAVPAKIDVSTLPVVNVKIITTLRFDPMDPVEVERQATLHGDLTLIHAAYERRDLATLWRVFLFEAGPDHRMTWERARLYNAALTQGQWQGLNRHVAAYVRRLIAQVPGHARFIGDRIEALSQGPDARRVVGSGDTRRLYFDLLTGVGSPECVRELGRFIKDARGAKPPAEREGSRYGDAEVDKGLWPGNNYPVANGWIAVRGMELALGDGFPLAGDRTRQDKDWGFMSWRPDGREAVEEWWLSEDARKYREPPPLPEPPKEPPPERVDVTALKGQ